jgi:hypothetical protein
MTWSDGEAGYWLLVHKKIEIKMSYKNLDIWERARKVSIDIHKMILINLPIPIAIGIGMYEEGSQIRRSSKSTRSNILEGYNFNQQQETSSKKPEKK